MEKTKIINQLKEYFNEVSKINDKENIYRCVKLYNEKPYQYFYFDLEMDLNKLNIEKYVKRILSNDYYSKPGSIQWNYYLAFILSSNQFKSINCNEKQKIENNESFARKFILKEIQLNEWLDNKYNPKIKTNTAIEQSLSGIWLNKLKQNNLTWLYDEKTLNLNRNIERIKKGEKLHIAKKKNIVKESRMYKFDKDPLINKIGHISSLKLNQYREILDDKEFSFKKINLITGSNGYGKTSLLEAIEYFICGANLRNPKSKKKYDIAISFDNIPRYLNFIEDNEIFRNRDKKWYKNYFYQKGNKLYEGFNKFNFFNTDAAFKLSNLKEKNDIELLSALEEIIIEPDINFLSNKLTKVYDRVSSELKTVNNEIETIEKYVYELNEEKKIIESKKFNPEKIQKQIPIILIKINWINVNKSLEDIDFPKSLMDMQIVQEDIKKMNSKLNWMTKISIRSILNKLKYYDDIINENSKIINHIRKIETNLKEKLTETKEIDLILEKILSIIPYFKSNAYKDLKGIGNKIKFHSINIKSLHECKDLFENIDSKYFKTIIDPISILNHKLEEKQSKLSSELTLINEKESQLYTDMESVKFTLNKLKANGLELLKQKPMITNCPLCNTKFSNTQELKQSIENTFKVIEDSKDLIDLMKNKKEIQNQIVLNKNHLQQIRVLKKIISILNIEEINTIKVIESITDNLKLMNSKMNELTEMEILRDKYKNEGFTEENLLEYLKFLKEHDVSENLISIENYKEEFLIKKKQLMLITEKLNQDDKLEKKQLEILFEKVKLQEKHVTDINNIEDRYNSLKSINPLLERLHQYLNISEDKDITLLLSDIKACINLIIYFIEEKKNKEKSDFTLKMINDKLKQSSMSIKNKKIIKDNIIRVRDVISNIFQDNSKENFIENFIEKNKKDICDIFNIIQAPNEFANIMFDKKTGIKLVRKNKRIAKLQEISTGQRSALAISIFLTLNKQIKNGPKYLIFDDPIAFTDDLNILSFLDYLREYMINSDRQIFFATANDNLAFLFKKKFDVFAEDFNIISLERD